MRLFTSLRMYILLASAVLQTTVVAIYDTMLDASINCKEAQEYAKAGLWHDKYNNTVFSIIEAKYNPSFIVEMKKTVDPTV
jgi:hypothetical protein